MEQKMNMTKILKMGFAAACIATAGQANAETLVLFSGSTVDGGTVTGTASGGVSKIYSVKAKGDLAHLTDLTTNYFIRVVDNVFQVTNLSKSIVYLGGEVTDVIDNSYGNTDMGNNGPMFLYSGRVDFTTGAWVENIRDYFNYSAEKSLFGRFAFTGTAAAPRGAETFSLDVTVVPEPAEWAALGIMATALAGLIIRKRVRKAKFALQTDHSPSE